MLSMTPSLSRVLTSLKIVRMVQKLPCMCLKMEPRLSQRLDPLLQSAALPQRSLLQVERRDVEGASAGMEQLAPK